METIVGERLADPETSGKREDFLQYLIQSQVITDPKILATSVMGVLYAGHPNTVSAPDHKSRPLLDSARGHLTRLCQRLDS
jgi:hypothetical protein